MALKHPTPPSFYSAATKQGQVLRCLLHSEHGRVWGVCACLCVHIGVCIPQPFSTWAGNSLVSGHHQKG